MGFSAVFAPIVMRIGDREGYIKGLVLGSWFRLYGTKIFKCTDVHLYLKKKLYECFAIKTQGLF